MVEQSNGFTEEKASYIQRQIQRADPTSSIFPDILGRLLFGRKAQRVHIDDISGEITPLMDLETVEEELFRAGFDFRIMRLQTLRLDRLRRSFFTFQDPDKISDDPGIIGQSKEVDGVIDSLIDASVRLAQRQLMEIETSQIQAQRKISDDTEDPQYSLDSNAARGWLMQAHGSGTILGVCFYDRNNDPASLKQLVEEQSRRILVARELVPPEIRKLINEISTTPIK